MKAFQLKVAIKNSKPPIWRRVVVPAGITFSQLSMILNQVMGWSGYHLFEFEFYHLELRIVEEADEFDLGYGPFDYMEASHTYIREYLEENDWFTYTYDLGDDWQHRVTVEKIIEDYEPEYPQVMKYKGDCPIEDCGGIYGYYECLEIIGDKEHPEHKDRLEWMKMQGYPNGYNMDLVNAELKERFFYKWGKGEKRQQGEIYEAHLAGECGLNATKRDKNKNTRVNMSGKHRLEEAMRQFEQMYNQKRYWEQKLATTSLADIFEDYEKEDILEIAKEKGLEGISKCNKKTLIKLLVTHMLQEDVARSYFLCLQDDGIKEIEAAAQAGGLYKPQNTRALLPLYESAYIGMLDDGRVMLPRDVLALYNSIKGKEFEADRKKVSYLLNCLYTIGALYGIAPMAVLVEMVKRNSAVRITESEIKSVINNLPPEFNEFIVKKDTIYRKAFYPDDRGLLGAQSNKEFYIPTLSEITDYGVYGYDTNSKEATALKKFLRKNMGADINEAELVCGVVQISITGGCEMQEIFAVFDEYGLVLEKERLINQLIGHINDLWNATRMIVNRGFTPNELSARENLQKRKTVRDNIIDFEQARKNKVYPNDPCPCGSGKKYKNCCKNKR